MNSIGGFFSKHYSYVLYVRVMDDEQARPVNLECEKISMIDKQIPI